MVVKWLLYFSKKGKDYDKIIKMDRNTQKLWVTYGYLVKYENDEECLDYMDYEGSKGKAKNYMNTFRDVNGDYIG
jgi:hypothetical protein